MTNAGDTTLERVLVVGNAGSFGGGLRNQGAGSTLSLTNVTVSGNTATDQGAGLHNSATATLINATIAANTSGSQTGGIHEATGGTTTNLTNTIVADNSAPTNPDVGGGFESQGFNFIESVGASSGWVASDQTGSDPLLQRSLTTEASPTPTRSQSAAMPSTPEPPLAPLRWINAASTGMLSPTSGPTSS